MSLRNGATLSAPTADHAQQWGEFALLTLAGVERLDYRCVTERSNCYVEGAVKPAANSGRA